MFNMNLLRPSINERQSEGRSKSERRRSTLSLECILLSEIKENVSIIINILDEKSPETFILLGYHLYKERI